ncbi:MAG TPA: ABC transporter permease [Gemmatimonadaceae bacterium]|jgi:predicted permease
MPTFRREVTYATRSLRRAPAFSITAVLILALGIGMTSAIFTVFQSVLLERMPVRDEDRIVELSGVAAGAASEFPLGMTQFRRFRDNTKTLQSAAAMAHWRVLASTFEDNNRPVVLREAVVTENFFQVLSAAPVLGRLFKRGDERPWGADNFQDAQAVLSYGAWQRLFGGDSSVIGRHLQEPAMGWRTTIVGIAPPGLDYPRGVEYWVASSYGSVDVVGRLTAGATDASARGEFRAFLDNDPEIARAFGAHTIGAQVHSLRQMVIGDAKPAVLVLTGAVALLLLLTCTNVGNLLLLRAAGRAREMAIRRAIGARSVDLFRQLLAESVIIACAGGLIGVVLARVLLATVVHLAPTGLPRSDLIVLAGSSLRIGALVTGLTVLMFGVLPSLVALHVNRASPLRSDTRSGTEGRMVRRVRQTLVACQLALAVIVLAGAGLLVRSLVRLTDLNMGYSPNEVTLLSVSLPWRSMTDECRPRGTSLTTADSMRWGRCFNSRNFDTHDRIMTLLRTIPSVVAASPVTAPPFLGSSVWMGKIVAEYQTESDAKTNPWFGLDLVGPEYFRMLNVPILEGRGFTDADREEAPRVAIVTSGVAHRLWPNESAIGKRFHDPNQDSPDSLVTIVGVVPDIHFREYRNATSTVFKPFRQVYAQGYFLVRTRGWSASGLAAMRRAVHDAGTVFVSAEPMNDLIAPQLIPARFDALLLSLFGAAAVLLAAIGLYGVVSAAVNQQTREIGVRMALGATAGTVRWMVLGRALAVSSFGVAIGLGGAVAGSRLLESLLFEVSPFDPMTLLGVTLLLLAIALFAAYLPARRATKIDPVRALRAE